MQPDLSRRKFLASTLAGFALAPAAGLWHPRHARAAAGKIVLTVHRDANCGCCHAWVDRLRASGAIEAELIDEPDMQAVKRHLGVPDALASCHTAEGGGYVFEGHVPPADIIRLFGENPPGVRGLAVPGMPTGSPGMEQPRGLREQFDVIAFLEDGSTRVYAGYPAATP